MIKYNETVIQYKYKIQKNYECIRKGIFLMV
jgi:hypothetical protein